MSATFDRWLEPEDIAALDDEDYAREVRREIDERHCDGGFGFAPMWFSLEMLGERGSDGPGREAAPGVKAGPRTASRGPLLEEEL